MIQNRMPATDLRSANMEARRERILDAALDLVASEGIEGVSMRKLAKRAGLSVQTLYNLFGSREDILLGLTQRFAGEVERLVTEDVALEDPLDRLRAMFSKAIGQLAEHESTYRPLLLALFRATPSTPVRLDPVWNRLARMGAPQISEAIERGLLQPGFSQRALTAHVLESYAWNLQQWADGLIDHGELEARTAYGLALSLLALASDDARPRLLRQLRQGEGACDGPPGRVEETPTRTRRGRRSHSPG